ncbi:MAG: VWA domain-containing protein, partial [Ruminococcus sp.]|nr:VWA domain-containing protein [Ruminococcus sp.]
NPEEKSEDIKRTTGDLAKELDLFSDVEPIKPAPKKSAALSSIVSSAFSEALTEATAVSNSIETATAAEPEPSAPEVSAPENVPDGVLPEAVPGIDDIIEPVANDEHIIQYTAEDKKRLLRDLGADAEFELPQDGKETVIKSGPKRFEPGETIGIPEKEKTEKPVKKPKYRRRKKIRDDEEKKSLAGTIALIAIILIIAYAGVAFYVHTANELVYETIAEELDPKTVSQVLDIRVPDPNVSAAEKESYGLSPTLVDSDNDGLSDHFEIDRGFAPALADTDGDGMPDGAEFLAGTDPREAMTDGTTKDSLRDYNYNIAIDEASVSIDGSWLIYETDFDIYPISFTNRPGVISGVYELVLPKGITSANISFDLSKVNTEKWGAGMTPAIYAYNPADGSFTKQDSADVGGTLSAAVGSGVYFVAADSVITAEAGLNIMFVIDNSGSMYSSELVDGSEENDLEFRRLDFAEDLIERMGDTANFGVGKFTLSYKLLSEISDNDQSAYDALESIRNGQESWDGTEISQSIISAVSRFEDYPTDRNFIIVITDGLPTNYNRDNEIRAIEICKENNISIITIGLGKKIDSEFLSEAAENTGGVYYQAVNNSSFESITEKIAEFLSADRYSKAPEMPDNAENESVAAVDVIMLADSGFDISEDGLRFPDIATADDPYGSDLGVALINKYYYAGILPLTAPSYNANDRTTVRAYDLSENAFFTDGKANLSEYEMPSVIEYGKYAAIKEKWDFNNIENSVAPLSKASLAAAKEELFSFENRPYSYDGSSSSPAFLRAITFRHNKPFTEYTAAVLDPAKITGEEGEVFAAINYYDNFYQKPGVYTYSFGVNGKTAFTQLSNELMLGRPSVLVADGKVYNAAKLSRMRNDGTSFIIEAYDPSSKSTVPVYIYLSSTRLLDGSGGFQYTAKFNKSDDEIQLYLIQNTGE